MRNTQTSQPLHAQQINREDSAWRVDGDAGWMASSMLPKSTVRLRGTGGGRNSWLGISSGALGGSRLFLRSGAGVSQSSSSSMSDGGRHKRGRDALGRVYPSRGACGVSSVGLTEAVPGRMQAGDLSRTTMCGGHHSPGCVSVIAPLDKHRRMLGDCGDCGGAESVSS